MPALGADMEAGTVTQWLVHPGDAVHRGQIVAIVETDKADVEVEVFEDGVVEELLVPEGARVDVGSALARVGPPSESTGPATPPAAPSAAAATPTRRRPRTTATRPKRRSAAGEPPAPTRWVAPPAPAATAPRATSARPEPTPRARERAGGEHPSAPTSPLVRRRATELGVDLAEVAGTGRDGTVTHADVERAARAARRPSSTSVSPGRARVSPRARRLAAERGVDVADLVGTGPAGAIVGDDVEAPTQTNRTGIVNAPKDRGVAMRRAIARAMARSKREIPHYYLAHDVDFSAAQAYLYERNAAVPVTERILPAVLLLKATAVAVRRTPELNGFWVDDELRRSDAVHLGVAISLRGGGLVAPAIHDADERTVEDLMAALRDLVNRARAGSLRASELSDPTITVTNLGDQGVQLVHGAIYPPQVALVGFGAILERPWAADGMVGARPVVTTTLAADHRASDGARGSLLLTQIASVLQEPTTL